MPWLLLTLAAWLAPLPCAADENAARTSAATTRPAATDVGPARRSFALTYAAVVPPPQQAGGRLDLWLPVPPTDAQQSITDEKVDAPFPYRFEQEAEYGNRVLHAWAEPPRAGTVTLRFHCTRLRERVEAGGSPADAAGSPGPRLLQPDRLGVIDDRIHHLAQRVIAGSHDTRSRARAIYDHVVDHMDYNKVAPGWGNGDTLRACDVGKGNCTDFHALFISLARASAIPARFDIGFALPEDKSSGPIAGYHCWAEFWDKHSGWTPVDCSESRQHADRREFYFAGLTASRIELSTGRDLTLPGMHGPALNYFLAPYAELDGKPLAGVERKVSFVEDPQQSAKDK